MGVRGAAAPPVLLNCLNCRVGFALEWLAMAGSGVGKKVGQKKFQKYCAVLLLLIAIFGVSILPQMVEPQGP